MEKQKYEKEEMLNICDQTDFRSHDNEILKKIESNCLLQKSTKSVENLMKTRRLPFNEIKASTDEIKNYNTLSNSDSLNNSELTKLETIYFSADSQQNSFNSPINSFSRSQSQTQLKCENISETDVILTPMNLKNSNTLIFSLERKNSADLNNNNNETDCKYYTCFPDENTENEKYESCEFEFGKENEFFIREKNKSNENLGGLGESRHQGVKILLRGDILCALNCLFPQLKLTPSEKNNKIPNLNSSFSLFSETNVNLEKVFALSRKYRSEMNASNKTIKIDSSFEREKRLFHISLEKYIRDELGKKLHPQEDKKHDFQSIYCSTNQTPLTKKIKIEPDNWIANKLPKSSSSSTFNKIIGFEKNLKTQNDKEISDKNKLASSTIGTTKVTGNKKSKRNSPNKNLYTCFFNNSNMNKFEETSSPQIANPSPNTKIFSIETKNSIRKYLDIPSETIIDPSSLTDKHQNIKECKITTSTPIQKRKKIPQIDLDDSYINYVHNFLLDNYPDRFNDFKQLEEIIQYMEKSNMDKINTNTTLNSNLPILNISQSTIKVNSDVTTASKQQKRLYSSVVKCSSSRKITETKKMSPKKTEKSLTVKNLFINNCKEFSSETTVINKLDDNNLINNESSTNIINNERNDTTYNETKQIEIEIEKDEFAILETRTLENLENILDNDSFDEKYNLLKSSTPAKEEKLKEEPPTKTAKLLQTNSSAITKSNNNNNNNIPPGFINYMCYYSRPPPIYFNQMMPYESYQPSFNTVVYPFTHNFNMTWLPLPPPPPPPPPTPPPLQPSYNNSSNIYYWPSANWIIQKKFQNLIEKYPQTVINQNGVNSLLKSLEEMQTQNADKNNIFSNNTSNNQHHQHQQINVKTKDFIVKQQSSIINISTFQNYQNFTIHLPIKQQQQQQQQQQQHYQVGNKISQNERNAIHLTNIKEMRTIISVSELENQALQQYQNSNENSIENLNEKYLLLEKEALDQYE